MYYNPYDPFGCAYSGCGCLMFLFAVIFFGLLIGAFLGA